MAGHCSRRHGGLPWSDRIGTNIFESGAAPANIGKTLLERKSQANAAISYRYFQQSAPRGLDVKQTRSIIEISISALEVLIFYFFISAYNENNIEFSYCMLYYIIKCGQQFLWRFYNGHFRNNN